MATATIESLAALYAEDETAWLEAMAELIRRRELGMLDLDNLEEYLTDMALRDRREVKSRLVVLLTHLLKWQFQPERRSRGWRTTVFEQRQRLKDLAGKGVLRVHAENVLEDAYQDALELAASETGRAADTFPEKCPYDVDQLLSIDLPESE